MKNYIKIFVVVIGLALLSFEKSNHKPFLISVEKIRVTQQSDLDVIAETTADMLIIIDRATAIPSGTCPLPAAPIDGQVFMISTRVDVTIMTLNTNSIPISGNPGAMMAGTIVGWCYDQVSNRWFPYHSVAVWGSIAGTLTNQTDLNAALALKAPLASPTFTGTVSGITASMVGLGNVTNESKATMFTSPAFTGTPTGIGIPAYSYVTGSNATTTGQALTDVTGLTASLVANAKYKFDAVMTGSVSAVTTGTQYGVQYSAAGASIEAQIVAASSTTATKSERINAFNTATTTFLATSAQSGGIRITGTITTGANAGTLSIRHLKVTSGTSTIFINSLLEIIRTN